MWHSPLNTYMQLMRRRYINFLILNLLPLFCRSTVHRGAFFQCTMENCGKQYKTRESITLHHKMVSHEGMELIEPGKYACDKCNENFLTKSLLDLHNIEEHLIIGPLKCSTCFETFNAFSELRGKFNNHSILYLCKYYYY